MYELRLYLCKSLQSFSGGLRTSQRYPLQEPFSSVTQHAAYRIKAHHLTSDSNCHLSWGTPESVRRACPWPVWLLYFRPRVRVDVRCQMSNSSKSSDVMFLLHSTSFHFSILGEALINLSRFWQLTALSIARALDARERWPAQNASKSPHGAANNSVINHRKPKHKPWPQLY